MTAPVIVRERDLRALAGIVSDDRPDLPDGEGLPPSLLADLMSQIRCDQVVFLGFDGSRQATLFTQEDPFKAPFTDTPGWEDLDRTYWQHYWIGGSAATPAAPVTCAASSRSRTSTRPGNGIPPLCTPITNGRWGWSTISWCACPKRRRGPPGLGGTSACA
jgi:hypothetical protein